jgi:hypothetical protein
MKTEDVALNKEGTAEGYLRVDIQWDGKQITFTQVGLTKRIIEALGLNSKFSTAVATPAKKSALGRDLGGLPASGQVNYASVIGMLLYLGHSCPDIVFFYTSMCHEDAFKRIGRYLKGTLHKGLILNPINDLKIDCYPDANFAGLWNRDDEHDPQCICSRTGYVIFLLNYPVLWISKVQTEIAHLNMLH